ncbi:uncharacterized protein [Argopecten irradians]|uniref:uncharacterized protein n=1 Tax=Argopecten irradians TaxID=31199 RepID=UPI00371B1737
MLNEYHACYWAVQSSHSYINLTACEDTGGYLAVIPSSGVSQRLGSVIDAAGSIQSYKYYWIDVNDLDEEGIYVNRFGPVSWTSWDSGQPNDHTETEDQDCTIMSPKYTYKWHDRNCLNELNYYTLCFYYPRGDGYRRRYVVHTDATNTTYGDLTQLIADIDSGVSVRVLIQEYPGVYDDFVIQADAVFSILDGDEHRCVQSVHNTAEQSSSQLRIVFYACTTGLLRQTTWAYDNQSEFSIGVKMTWFTSDHPTTVVSQTMGAFDPSFNLTFEIVNGTDFMISVGSARYPLYDMYYGTNMTGQFPWIASKTNWTSVMLDQEGYLNTVDWWDSSTHTFNRTSQNYTLLTSNNWKFVYSNSGGGSLVSLLEYVDAGHELKVDTGERVSIVEMIFFNNHEIYAMLASELVSEDMETDLKRTVTIVSSSGEVISYEFGFEQNTYLNNHTRNSTVRWFVDTSVWTWVYRTSPVRGSSHADFTLHDAVFNGQPIRIKLDTNENYNLVFAADFLTYTASSSVYFASHSRGFSYSFLNHGGISMKFPVHHLQFEIDSNGDCKMLTIPNGMSTVTSTTNLNAIIYWYSKPYLF